MENEERRSRSNPIQSRLMLTLMIRENVDVVVFASNSGYIGASLRHYVAQMKRMNIHKHSSINLLKRLWSVDMDINQFNTILPTTLMPLVLDQHSLDTQKVDWIVSLTGQSVAGQLVAGQSVAGLSVAGQSVAGQWNRQTTKRERQQTTNNHDWSSTLATVHLAPIFARQTACQMLQVRVHNKHNTKYTEISFIH